MKILAIGPIPGPITGMALAFESFVNALKKNHHVQVIDLSKTAGDDFLGRLLRLGQGVHFAWTSFFASRDTDIIYFKISESRLGNLKDIAIYLACAGKLPRMVVHLNGGAGMRVLLHESRSTTRMLNRFFLSRMHRVIVLGPRLVDIFDGIVAPERIATAPNFAAGELFISEEALRYKLADLRPLRLLFLSNLLWGKGHDELVGALKGLTPGERDAIHLDVAGAFESERQGKAFLSEISELTNVTYHGIVTGDARVRLFQQAHIFCLPTYYPSEGQPLSILEAYAAGCAVLTTDHSGIFDVFAPNENGYCVEKRSSISITAALRKALDDPDGLRRFAEKNRRDADRFTESAFVERLEKIVVESLQGEQ